jgi:proline racemase
MRAAIRNISACIFSAMKGKAMSNEIKIASIFGTKARVDRERTGIGCDARNAGIGAGGGEGSGHG